MHPDWRLLEHRDVCTLSGRNLLKAAGLSKGDVTLLVGGPPCQPFSRARAWAGPPPGRKDVRARTLTAFFRIAAETAPQVMLLENVPGLATAADSYLRRKVQELGRLVGETYSSRIHQKCKRLTLVYPSVVDACSSWVFEEDQRSRRRLRHTRRPPIPAAELRSIGPPGMQSVTSTTTLGRKIFAVRGSGRSCSHRYLERGQLSPSHAPRSGDSLSSVGERVFGRSSLN